MDYKRLILAGSFTCGNGQRCVNADLINEVASLWALNERGVAVIKQGTEQGKDVYPL